MARKDIQSRRDTQTKDMQPTAPREREWDFKTLGITVKAKTYQEALSKAKKQISK